MATTSQPNPPYRTLAMFLFLTAAASGILTILFSGFTAELGFYVNPAAELLSVILGAAMFASGAIDLIENLPVHQEQLYGDLLALGLFILVVVDAAFLFILFYLHLGQNFHVVQSDLPYGIILGILLILFAILDLVVSHIPRKS